MQGFDLHANVAVKAGKRQQLERLCRYVLRPPLAQDSLELTANGKVLGYVRPRHFAWADLLRRTFELDILACPDCGGRLRFLATTEEREVVTKILAHLGLPTEAPNSAPPRAPPCLPGFGDSEASDTDWDT